MKYKIFIVEQVDDGLFNRGLLNNIGARYIENKNSYICFHDVDILPVEGTNYYKPDDNSVNHLYGYKFSLGGIFSINYQDFVKINGFSNSYKGWGYEDNDIKRRTTLLNLKIDRSFFNERYSKGTFTELDPDKTGSNKKMLLPQTTINKEIFEKNINFNDDGFNKIVDYKKFVTIKPKDGYTIISCQIEDIEKANSL